jgi:hypothetical protein
LANEMLRHNPRLEISPATLSHRSL